MYFSADDKKTARVSFAAEPAETGRSHSVTESIQSAVPGVSFESHAKSTEGPLLTPEWMGAPATIPVASRNVEAKESTQPKRKSLFALRMEKSRSNAMKNADGSVREKDLPKSENKFGKCTFIFDFVTYPHTNIFVSMLMSLLKSHR